MFALIGFPPRAINWVASGCAPVPQSRTSRSPLAVVTPTQEVLPPKWFVPGPGVAIDPLVPQKRTRMSLSPRLRAVWHVRSLRHEPEDRHLQRERHRHAREAFAGMAREGIPRCRLPAGAKGDRRALSRQGAARHRLPLDLARAAVVERGGDPREGREADRDAARP